MKTTFVLLFALLHFSAFSQKTEANFENLTFISDFEKITFQNFEDGIKQAKQNYFLCPSKNMDNEKVKLIEERISFLISRLQAFTGQKKTNYHKFAKKLHTLIHGEILKQYRSDAFFEDIFNTGDFNCVTASALYAIVLDSLSIPFQIKVMPYHVFLIIDPGNTNIKIETTSTENGIISFSMNTQKNFVSFLKENKLITETEFAKASDEILFQKYYYPQENINIRKLAGIQYYNMSILTYQLGKQLEAVNLMEKANFLFPNTKFSYIQNFLSYAILLSLNTDIESVEKAKRLSSKLGNYALREMKSQYFSYFQDLCENYLINQQKPAIVSDCYETLKNNINDSIFRAKLAKAYGIYLSYYYIQQNDYYGAAEFVAKGIELNPDDIELDNSLNKVLNRITQLPIFTSDSMLAKLTENYPVLEQKFTKNGTKSTQLLRKATHFYKTGSEAMANETYAQFRKTVPAGNQKFVYSQLLMEYYLSASSYYYRGNDLKKALQVIDEGLAFLPGETRLLEQRRSIELFLKIK
jgi:tetratricopeptide (TPR) repeat protein